jgi:trimethylamine:corrinoid methyltransferase-like protein
MSMHRREFLKNAAGATALVAVGTALDPVEAAAARLSAPPRTAVAPAMDPAIREALEAYVARRKEQIGSGEP